MNWCVKVWNRFPSSCKLCDFSKSFFIGSLFRSFSALNAVVTSFFFRSFVLPFSAKCIAHGRLYMCVWCLFVTLWLCSLQTTKRISFFAVQSISFSIGYISIFCECVCMLSHWSSESVPSNYEIYMLKIESKRKAIEHKTENYVYRLYFGIKMNEWKNWFRGVHTISHWNIILTKHYR